MGEGEYRRPCPRCFGLAIRGLQHDKGREGDDGFRIKSGMGEKKTTEIPSPSQEEKVRMALNGRKVTPSDLQLLRPRLSRPPA